MTMSRPHRNRPPVPNGVLRAPLSQHVDLLLRGEHYAARLHLLSVDPDGIFADIDVIARGGHGLGDALAGFPARGDDNPDGEIAVWLEDDGSIVHAEFHTGRSTGTLEPSTEHYELWFPVTITSLSSPTLHLAWPSRTDHERIVPLDRDALLDASREAIVLDDA